MMKRKMLAVGALLCAMGFTGCAGSAQKASEGGFQTVETPATQLEEYKAELDKMIGQYK